MPDFDKSPWSDIADFVRHEVLPVLLIIVAAYVALRLARLFVHGVVKTLLDREATEGTAQELSAVELKKRMDTLDSLGANALQFFIVVIACLMILGQIGLDIGPAVAGLGIVGIAVGFGAQFLVRDYLNGSLILIENQFCRGDVVRLAGVEGTVEDFTLRRTTLRDLDGVVHTVPNGEIKVASNLTRVWSRINQDVTVAYGTDIERAIEVVDEVGPDDGRAIPSGAAASSRRPRVERVADLAEDGRHAQDPGDRPGGRPVVRRERLPASACSTRSGRTASRSPGRCGDLAVPDPAPARPDPAPDDDDLAEDTD